MPTALFCRVFAAVTVVDSKECAVYMVEKVVLEDVNVLHVFPSFVGFFANANRGGTGQVETFAC